MAAQKVVVEGSSGVTASQLKDLFRQIEDGSIHGKYFQRFLEHSLGVLKPIWVAPLPAVQCFVAAAHFTYKRGVGGPHPRIAAQGKYFAEYFLPKVEENISAGRARCDKLLRTTSVNDIRAELDTKHEMYLADIWAMMAKQPHGHQAHGDLHDSTNFFVLDKDGNPGEVHVYWNWQWKMWEVSARSILSSNKLEVSEQLVSRGFFTS